MYQNYLNSFANFFISKLSKSKKLPGLYFFLKFFSISKTSLTSSKESTLRSKNRLLFNVIFLPYFFLKKVSNLFSKIIDWLYILLVMLIKTLNFNHYKKIKKLLKNNYSQIPTFKSWKLLSGFSKNNSSLLLDGLFYNNELVGYHSVISKNIIFKRKKFKVLISSNWNVSKKFRSNSMSLINKYFKLKADFYLTTTANRKTAKFWRTYGALEVNNISCKSTLFKITNYGNLLRHFFKKKKINFIPKLFINIIALFLKVIFFYKEIVFNKKIISFKKIKKNSAELETFNKKFESSVNYPLEQRSSYMLCKHIDILEKNKKKSYTYQILKNEIMIGYIVLIGERHQGYKRLFLGDFKIVNKYNFCIKDVFSFATTIAKQNNYSFIYFKNLHPNILRYINKRNFFITYNDFNPYLIKIGSKKAKKLKFFFKNSWGTSYLDGDCLI